MADSIVKELFLDAAELPAPEREAFLDRRCAGDTRLRARVDALLDADRRAGDFLAEPTTDLLEAPEGLDVAPPPAPDEHAPIRVGRYTTVRVLGEGGYGTVYLARQDEPVKRHVALKVIKPGMDSRQVIRRFEAERQTLALMDHPNIARVLDAGTTEAGRPYFVMELVDGQPITTYCNAKRLTIDERLRLFEQVCHAVQHAHQKGIIHRDIKPTNVLVTSVDGVPTPKVIDFGIAKALTGAAPEHTALTEARQVIGTPQYMSPEQATPAGDVDTRSDVYSLGVLLYEILAGVPPFEPDRLRTATYAELERIIREEDPPRPSTRVRALGDEADQIASDRITDPRRLSRELRGELDWVVMRAMDKDRNRRYPTAYALGADLVRLLRDEPVEARPPSRAYRLSKFARRHRVGIAVATLFISVCTALLIGSLLFAYEADTQRRAAEHQLVRADALGTFAKEIITGVDPAVARAEDTTLLRRLLADAADRVAAELTGQPEAAVDMLTAIGVAYRQIAEYDEALPVLREAVRRGRAEIGPTSPLTLDAEMTLAALLVHRSDFEAAERRLLDLRRTLTDTRGPDDRRTLEARSNLAYVYNQTGRHDLALAEWEDVLEHRRRVLGPDDDDTVATMNNVASALSRLGDERASLELLERVLEHQAAADGEDHPRTLATMNNIADSYIKLGRTDEALEMLRRVLEAKRRVLPPDHPSLAITMNNLAHACMTAGRLDEAEAVLADAHASALRSVGENDLITITLKNTRATALRRLGRHDEARTLLGNALDALHATVGEGHPHEAHILANLARVHLEAGDLDEALTASARAETIARDVHGAFASRALGVEIVRAEVLGAAGELDEAEGRLLRVHDACLELFDADHRRTREAATALADLYERAGRADDAAQWRARLPED